MKQAIYVSEQYNIYIMTTETTDIKITFRTVDSKSAVMNINPNSIIETEIDNIKNAIGLTQMPTLRLVYKGKILKNDTSFAFNEITSDSVVIVAKGSVKNTQPTPVAAPSFPYHTMPVGAPSFPSHTMPVAAPSFSSHATPDHAPLVVPSGLSHMEEMPNFVGTTETNNNNFNNDETDTHAMYSLQQIHSTIPILLILLSSSPHFMVEFLQNPVTACQMLFSSEFRGTLRELLSSTNPAQNADAPESDTSDAESHSSEQSIIAPISLPVHQIQDVDTHGSDTSTESSSSNPSATTQTGLSAEDNINIDMIAEMTGVTKNEVTQVYFACSKDMNITANYFLNQ